MVTIYRRQKNVNETSKIEKFSIILSKFCQEYLIYMLPVLTKYHFYDTSIDEILNYFPSKNKFHCNLIYKLFNFNEIS